MDPIAWAALLLGLGFALAVLEFFIPSGGILGISALVALVVANGMAFNQGAGAGLIFLAITVLALPVVFFMAAKVWPHTPIGRRLLLMGPNSDEVLPDSERRRQLKLLEGKIGRAKTLMMPSGAIEIEGQTIDAMSQGVAIEAGEPVRVIEVHGLQVIVRPQRGARPTTSAGGDPLSQSVDALGGDPFEENRPES